MVLIFDMDGVIVDNHQFHFDAFVEFGKKPLVSGYKSNNVSCLEVSD